MYANDIYEYFKDEYHREYILKYLKIKKEELTFYFLYARLQSERLPLT